MTLVIHTDGSCLKNPGPGGWAFRIEAERVYLVSGGATNTTNNRMELLAVIEALKFCRNGTKCKIYSDSQLTIKCASGVYKRKANLDLWDDYNTVSKNIDIEWQWVKGHSGDPRNEEVDVAARTEAEKFKLKSL
jgi:ribonuclease HI